MMNYSLWPSPDIEVGVIMAIANDYTRPEEALENIVEQLKKREIKGKVIFDLLLANGTRTRRYFASEFDGERFGRFERLDDRSIPLREASVSYFCSGAEYDTSILFSGYFEELSEVTP